MAERRPCRDLEVRESSVLYKNVKKSHLPVLYFHHKKAWMTGNILDHVHPELNGTLIANGCSVLLHIDNAGCHPEDLDHKYMNIRIVFLSANTTAALHLLDLEIIQNFKVYY